MLIWTWRKIFQRVHHLISHVDIETWRRRQGLTAVSAVLLLVGAEPAAIGTPYADICSPWKSIISTMDEKSWNSLTWSPCENCAPLEEAPCSISAFHINMGLLSTRKGLHTDQHLPKRRPIWHLYSWSSPRWASLWPLPVAFALLSFFTACYFVTATFFLNAIAANLLRPSFPCKAMLWSVFDMFHLWGSQHITTHLMACGNLLGKRFQRYHWQIYEGSLIIK